MRKLCFSFILRNSLWKINCLTFSFISASVDFICKDKAQQQLLSEHVNYYFFRITECKYVQGDRGHVSITGSKVFVNN